MSITDPVFRWRGFIVREHIGFAAALDKTQRKEGELTRILYVNPPERSALEVFRNYRQALANAGFGTLFECEGKAGCGVLFHAAIYPMSQAFTRSQQAQFALSGVGPLAPVAANTTGKGRARNRRVELVARTMSGT